MKSSILTVTILFIAVVFSSAKNNPAQDALKLSIERGKKVYDNTCLACHQVNGSGVPGMNPPLKKTKWVLGDKKVLINIVLKGLDQEIEVNDETYSNVMPAFAHLSDQEIADVLTYVRNSFGNKASQVTEAEVKKLRDK
ncbi:MAG: cytochrome c [Chitinophagaceae bacterium]|nr:cytochrome c [Chitinophagaceae bacterium]